jgi:hypothetical protein
MIRRGSLPVVEPPVARGARSSPSSSHVRVRRLDEPDNLDEPWPDDPWS